MERVLNVFGSLLYNVMLRKKANIDNFKKEIKKRAILLEYWYYFTNLLISAK